MRATLVSVIALSVTALVCPVAVGSEEKAALEWLKDRDGRIVQDEVRAGRPVVKIDLSTPGRFSPSISPGPR